MPFGDGTGPMGMGPMTGRGAGYCAGYSVPGNMNPVGGRGFGGGWGRGFGRGRGGGWGRGRGFWSGWNYPVGAPVYGVAPVASGTEQELVALKQQSEYLQGALEDISKRIEEIEAEQKK